MMLAVQKIANVNFPTIWFNMVSVIINFKCGYYDISDIIQTIEKSYGILFVKGMRHNLSMHSTNVIYA